MNTLGWPSTFGYTIFCDDVRQEVGNKSSFMGVYNGRMLLNAPSLPFGLPKFVMVPHYFEEPDAHSIPLELRISMPGDDEDEPSFRLPVPSFTPTPPEQLAGLGDNPRMAWINPIILAPLIITQEGSIVVRMARGDDQLVRLGRLLIQIVPNHDNLNRDTLTPT